MSILQRYLLRQFVKNSLTILGVLLLLFLLIDVTDRLDTILSEDATFLSSVNYFLLKLPNTLVLMLPVSVLGGSLFTFAMLHKNSELIAMRGAGAPVWWLSLPMLVLSICVSLFSILFSETVVPAAQKKMRMIYNIDIQKKDQKGIYSQNNIWWREGDTFYSSDAFDSKTNTLKNVSAFRLSKEFRPKSRVIASEGIWVSKQLGWDLQNATQFIFRRGRTPEAIPQQKIPMPVKRVPKDFFDSKTEVDTMSFLELRGYLAQQKLNGLPVSSFLADLYEKLAFPFVSFFIVLTACAFAIRTVRSTNLAITFLLGLGVAFLYFSIHSFSVALGRAELLPPLLAAWGANIILAAVGFVLHLSAENPR